MQEQKETEILVVVTEFLLLFSKYRLRIRITDFRKTPNKTVLILLNYMAAILKKLKSTKFFLKSLLAVARKMRMGIFYRDVLCLI